MIQGNTINTGDKYGAENITENNLELIHIQYNNYITPTLSMQCEFSTKIALRINTDKSGFNHASA